MRFLSSLFGLGRQGDTHSYSLSSSFNHFPPEILGTILLYISARSDFISFALISPFCATVASTPYLQERWFKAHYDDASTAGCEYSLTPAEMEVLGYNFEHYERICNWLNVKYEWVDQDSLADDLCEVLMGCWGGVGCLYDLARMPHNVARKIVQLVALASAYHHETVRPDSGLSELIVPGEAHIVFCSRCKSPGEHHAIFLNARIEPKLNVGPEEGTVGKSYSSGTVFPLLRPYDNSTDVFFGLDPDFGVVTGRSVYKIIVPAAPAARVSACKTTDLSSVLTSYPSSTTDPTPDSNQQPSYILSYTCFRDLFHYIEYSPFALPPDAMMGEFTNCRLLRDVDPSHGLCRDVTYSSVEVRCDWSEGWVSFFESMWWGNTKYQLRCCGVRWEAGIDRDRWGLLE